MSSSLVYNNKTSGQKMVRLSDKQLDVKLDFIRDYMGSSNAATSSKFDANANVSKKNIATLSAEINKDINIQINRHMLVNKIIDMFGIEMAQEYVRQLDEHEIYSHDETNLAPYTYGASEAIVVYKNGEKLLTTFEQLYAMYPDLQEELLDEDEGVWAKYPKDLFIDDVNGKTRVTRLVKKTRHRDMVRVKTQYGEDLIVTDNHPLIVERNNIEATIQAIDSVGQKQFKKDTVFAEERHFITPADVNKAYEDYGDYCIYGINDSKRVEGVKSKIPLNDKLGYAVGFFIAEGSYSKSASGFGGIDFTQGNKEALKKVANYIFEVTGIAGKIYLDVSASHANRNPKYVLSYGSSAFLYRLFSEYFQIPPYAERKALPINLYSTNKDFIDGLISGLIDGDGSAGSGRSISIRVASRALMTQLAVLLRSFGVGIAMSYQEQPETAFGSFSSNYPIFGVSFGLTGQLTFALSEKVNTYRDQISHITRYQEKESEIISVTKVVNKAYLDNFIYDITTKSHQFLCNNLQVHNCVSITMYPFLTEGLRGLGGESAAPKHVDSFCGSFVNLVFAVSSQFSGAVATGEFLMYLDYFCRKDYGDNYLETHTQKITNHLQHVIYALNQPAAARGYQSAFWNISVFDKFYFESLFENFMFPVITDEDKTKFEQDPDFFKPNWQTVSKLQDFFMHWFNDERTRALLTFPVVTAAFLVDEQSKKPRDKDFTEMLAQEMSEGNSFFIYTSDKADSLSSCCFHKDQMVVTKSSFGINHCSFEEIYNAKWNDKKKNFTILHNGSWAKGKIVKLPNRPMFKITLMNNKEIVVSDNHLHPTLRGDIATNQLEKDDYLLFNTNKLDSFPEKDIGLTYEQGVAVGAFLGDGSYGSRVKLASGDVKIYEIAYSLNGQCHSILEENINKANAQLGKETRLNTTIIDRLYTSRISSEPLVNLIKTWTSGCSADTKTLNLDCLLQSYEFRRGIIDGWYLTDGGNSNRCYTVSVKLKDAMEILLTSLGMCSIIDVADRTGKMEIKGIEYQRNHPLWCVRWYEPKNKRSMGDTYIFRNNSMYFKIKSIESVEYEDSIYCFEMRNQDEPYFTLPNGLITHNCRLRNELSDNTFSFTLGAGGIATGSINVITMNVNRLVQNALRECVAPNEQVMHKMLKDQVEKIHKYQIAYRRIMEEFKEKGLLTIYDAGFIDLSKQFLTLGVNGLVEAAEAWGLVPGNNDEYIDWTGRLLKVIFDTNKEGAAAYKVKFNTEMVPAENLGVKNAKWDKQKGYTVLRDCYNSYFYPVEDMDINALDKFVLHGERVVRWLDGGSALHLNIEQYMTKAQYLKLFEIAGRCGTNYWTTNCLVTICNDCGNIDKNKQTACPKCNGQNLDYATRVIGYLKKVSSFSLDRQIEESKRFYHPSGLKPKATKTDIS